MEALLDRSKKYCILLPDECFWRFEFKSLDDHFQWVAYRKRPGAEFVLLGGMPEVEVFHKLSLYTHKLDSEDKEDLLFYLYLGGIELFLEQEKDDGL